MYQNKHVCVSLVICFTLGSYQGGKPKAVYGNVTAFTQFKVAPLHYTFLH